MIHEIGADGVVHIHLEGEFELGTDAVHARNQDRVGVFGLIYREEATEAANLTEDAFGESFVGEILDALFGTVGLVYVDACIGVSDGFGRILGHGASGFNVRGPGGEQRLESGLF